MMNALIKSMSKILAVVLLTLHLSSCSWDAKSNATCKSHDRTVTRMNILASDLSKRVEGQFLIIAHRGYSSKYPENSVNAFKGTISAGADLIETDLRESADGAIVLSHDYAGGNTLSALKEQGFTPLPTLLKLAKNRIALLLDMKEGNPLFLCKVIDLVDEHGMLDQVIFGVRDIDQTRELRKLSSTAVISQEVIVVRVGLVCSSTKNDFVELVSRIAAEPIVTQLLVAVDSLELQSETMLGALPWLSTCSTLNS